MEPTIYCSKCGVGPFFYVAERDFPALCNECSDEAHRESSSVWQPEYEWSR